MDPDLLRRFEAELEAEQRKPLAELRRTSGKQAQKQSFAGAEAAENLLMKALRALKNDDVKLAERFVRRSLALPFDEHEQVLPAVHAVHMMLFLDVSDELEASFDGDMAWLDDALAILPECAPLAERDLLECLAVIRHDEDVGSYAIQPTERKRIDKALRGRPDIHPPMGAPAPEDPETYVREVLDAVRMYGRR